jgi:hypothetical protein
MRLPVRVELGRHEKFMQGVRLISLDGDELSGRVLDSGAQAS